MLIGYLRVSKADGSQTNDLQRDALIAAVGQLPRPLTVRPNDELIHLHAINNAHQGSSASF